MWGVIPNCGSLQYRESTKYIPFYDQKQHFSVTVSEIRKHGTFNSLIKEENVSYILTKRWYLVYLHMVPGTNVMTQ